MGRKEELEAAACTPVPIRPDGFNPHALIPYGCITEHIHRVMTTFVDFLGFINIQLHSQGLSRLESFIMPANFSSIVGEFMTATLPTYCQGLVKNRHHNGHPDLIPPGVFPANSVLHATKGIEVKASRYLRGWQGHNPENVWLLVFVFDSNRPKDAGTEEEEAPKTLPKPFRFIKVVGAQLIQTDWRFSGRAGTSRRTITASVTNSGYEKMERNWIYRDPGLSQS